MIPLRDDAPRTTTPFVTYFLIAMNVMVFLFELSLNPQLRAGFLYQFGVVPSV
ncbi:MAG: Peptidase rhomboid domain protein, partial [Acidobacteriaceae bacterium]|nr:Peptidase rhomboid domain protein [Acidobacteriaceae bacterium]